MFARSLAALALTSLPVLADPVETSAGPMQITRMADGFTEPWGIAFLPDGGFLVTERDGRLTLLSGDLRQEVQGLPELAVQGQGGLLDVMVPGDFATTREIWLSYAARPRMGLPRRRAGGICRKTVCVWNASRRCSWATGPGVAAISAPGWSRRPTARSI